MRAIPVPFCYPHLAALLVFFCLFLLLSVRVCFVFFCALPFDALSLCRRQQQSQIETQTETETSFPLWRDIALHLRTGTGRTRTLKQPPPVPVASHLPAGVPLASHREKVYFKHSHKYWDWVFKIRPGQLWHLLVWRVCDCNWDLGPLTKFTCSVQVQVQVRVQAKSKPEH